MVTFQEIWANAYRKCSDSTGCYVQVKQRDAWHKYIPSVNSWSSMGNVKPSCFNLSSIDAICPTAPTNGNGNGNTCSSISSQQLAREANEMAVGLRKKDLRYDVDKDGRVTATDALLICQGTPLRSTSDVLMKYIVPATLIIGLGIILSKRKR